MQCPYCGRQLSNGARFCPSCGGDVTAASAPQGPPQPQPRVQRQPQAQVQRQPQPPQARRQPQPQRQANQMSYGPAAQQMSQPYPQQGYQPAPAAAPGAYPPNNAAQPTAGDSTGKTMAIVSLVLGILSILMGALFYFVNLLPFFGLVMSITGLVLAVKSKQRGFASPLRTAGFVCSILGIIIDSLLVLFCIVVFIMVTVASS